MTEFSANIFLVILSNLLLLKDKVKILYLNLIKLLFVAISDVKPDF